LFCSNVKETRFFQLHYKRYSWHCFPTFFIERKLGK